MSNTAEEDQKVQKEGAFDLLEGAVSSVSSILHEIRDQQSRAADHSLPLETRLQAFEDIFESEVGDTTLSRARNIEREVGVRQLYLKFEGGNPTGTQKDRIAFAQVLDALRRGYDSITMATCGNYGVAMAFAASIAGLGCRIYIPDKYHTKRMQEMERLGARIFRTPGDYEESVKESSKAAAEKDYYD
ncbi:MAG TPA: pyridoxal-phosphate dependent enzyme, partial [Spirochaetia bacterium]|nr:pyridoxal-phosphate dependent enzyme [Spirochaetia bacterium]